jgi:hypothetical protein
MPPTPERVSLEEQVLSVGEQLSEGRWSEYVGDLMDSHGQTTRDITACLLENQRTYLSSLDETTKQQNVGNFLKFAFPMVRAIFPNLVAMDLVSVQPMQGPVSLIFYLDFLYGSTKGDINRGDRLYKAGFPHQVNDDPALYDGHDNNFLYSTETVPLEDTGVVIDSAGEAALTNYTAQFRPIKSASAEIFVGPTRAQAVKVGFAQADGSIADISGDGITVAGAAGAVTLTTGVINGITIEGADEGDKVYVTYQYQSEGTSQVMEIDLQLTSTSVEANPRKLKANWSVEAANDLKALHNLDVEAELTAVLADQIRFEIDREIIEDLSGMSTSHGVGVRSWSRSTGGNYSYYEKKMEFYDELIERSNQIFKMTRRASGNWVVMGIDVANVVEALPGFQPSNVTGNGVVKTGTLRGQWDIFKDPYFKSDEYLVGYKGNSFLDAGYVFAPYIPLFTTPTYMFADFVGTKGMMTRYGKKIVNNRFVVKGKVTS